MPDARLVLAGDVPERGALEARARERGVAERTSFLGLRNDVSVILRGLDVAVMSSDFEGLPLFACECLHVGTPLVATAVGGLKELVQDGRSGVLVPRRDPAALAGGIVSLLRDPARREAMAEGGRARLEDFTIDRVVPRFVELYDRLLRERRR